MIADQDLDLVIERNEHMQLKILKFCQTKAERKFLQDEIHEHAFERLKEITGGEFNCRYGEDHLLKPPRFWLDHCFEPAIELLERYNKIGDDS